MDARSNEYLEPKAFPSDVSYERQLDVLVSIAISLKRIADVLDPKEGLTLAEKLELGIRRSRD